MSSRSIDHFGGALSDAVRLNVCRNISSNLSSDNNGTEDLLKRIENLLEENAFVEAERRVQADEAVRAFVMGRNRLVQEGEETLKELEESVAQVGDCLRTAKPFLTGLHEEDLTDAEATLKEVRTAETRLEYLKWLELFHDQSDRIRSSLACDSTSDAMAFLQTLMDWCEHFRSSSCIRLRDYLHDVTVYWTTLVCDQVARELPAVLARIGFPRPPSVRNPETNIVDSRSRNEIADIVTLLLRLRLPDYIKPLSPGVDTPFLHELLPLKYFIAPLEKRFRFHFFMSDKTNRLDKPEWYFTQILSWIRDYGDFIDDLFQLSFRGEALRSSKSDFALGLAVLGRSKFLSSLSQLLEDGSLFAHAMDELLTFAKTLRALGYESVQRTFCTILVQPEVFHPWFAAETSLAESRADAFLASPTAWNCQYQEEDGSPEDAKAPECAQQFITMLKGITDRYSLLPSSLPQFDFLSLQLDLVEDFNERLKSHYEANQEDTEQCARIILPTQATATKFVGEVLADMASTPLIVELLSLSDSRSSPECGRKAKSLAVRLTSILDECNRLARESYLTHLRNDTLDSIHGLVREFARQGWKSMPAVTEFLVASMTPAMGELLYVTKTLISSQRDRLLTSLFTRYTNTLMQALDQILLEEVIYDNTFSTGGASQVKFDIVNNFAVVLGRLVHLPHAGLSRTMEACNVLTINRGSAMLLVELFEGGGAAPKADKKQHSDDIRKALGEMNLLLLKPEEVELILHRRSDLDV
ncbi:RAD50-interacting protein 1 [Hypsibius exemplaris]|uniref:RAD50-interacting protein 1 n=1 Tax=Hypsibius exemplaris TaxID=2072580 RepID=A0A1W0X467_HYPEX|nr:RAD50-interacting protein 1 [Hypsibius exemplaris]